MAEETTIARALAHRSSLMACPGIFALPRPVLGLAYLTGYVALDWISFIHPFAPFGITPWNPPTGLSFVLLLLFGQKFLPLLFVAPLLADLAVRHLPYPWPVEIMVTLAVGGGYSLGLVYLLRPATRFDPALTSMRDLILLMAVAAASAALVSLSYVGTLILAGLLRVADALPAALQFWVGDMIGIAVVAPFALIALTRGRSLPMSAETALQLAAVVAALALVFLQSDKHHFQLFYILFLPIVWMATRGGLEAVTLGLLLTQLGLILAVQLLPTEDVSVTAFQALMLVLAMTGLVAAALVTEHRRTQFQLRLHQESLARLARLGSMGELAAMVAHEINQPLMAAGTYSRLVADALRSSDDRAAALDIAGKAVAQIERAAEVVRRLRALIRLDQSGRAPTSVERIVRETLDLCRPELDRHGVATAVTIAPNLPPVMVDLLQIEHVLLNLVRNAAEAMRDVPPGRAVVTIEASGTGGDGVEIAVSDTGPGFPPGLIASKIPPLSSTKAEGLGIGLSLSRSIIESHGGRFSTGNAARGAVVRFSLPAARPADG